MSLRIETEPAIHPEVALVAQIIADLVHLQEATTALQAQAAEAPRLDHQVPQEVQVLWAGPAHLVDLPVRDLPAEDPLAAEAEEETKIKR